MDVIESWTDFNVAMTGATAALAGFVIVAISVNIGDIIKFRSIIARLAAVIAALTLAIGISAAGLIPGLTAGAYGAGVVVGGLIAAAFAVNATVRIFTDTQEPHRVRVGKALVGFVSPALYTAGGVMLLVGLDGGLLLLAAGSLAAIVATVFAAWIVLVEVLR